jgi:hypothetical protein
MAAAEAGPDDAVALQLLVAVSAKTGSHGAGVATTNAAINIAEMVAAHVLPELAAPDVEALPVVRAGCLKFLATFRNQLPAEALRAAMPLAAAHLASSSRVVVSTGASAPKATSGEAVRRSLYAFSRNAHLRRNSAASALASRACCVVCSS